MMTSAATAMDGGILESILEVGILRQALASTHPVEPGSGQFVSVF